MNVLLAPILVMLMLNAKTLMVDILVLVVKVWMEMVITVKI